MHGVVSTKNHRSEVNNNCCCRSVIHDMGTHQREQSLQAQNGQLLWKQMNSSFVLVICPYSVRGLDAAILVIPHCQFMSFLTQVAAEVKVRS